jgi:protoporphyrinogen oxidase
MATEEIEKLGLAKASQVEKGYVTRVPLAYPMYDEGYKAHVETIKGWLETFDNVQQVGRNGLHRYNNSDHSMLTAMRAVENICDGADHDLWAVNAESVYHEESSVDDNPYPYKPSARQTASHAER